MVKDTRCPQNKCKVAVDNCVCGGGFGYAAGAILTRVIADTWGINASILTIGLLTILSAGIIFYRMKCGDNAIKIWKLAQTKL